MGDWEGVPLPLPPPAAAIEAVGVSVMERVEVPVYLMEGVVVGEVDTDGECVGKALREG